MPVDKMQEVTDMSKVKLDDEKKQMA